MLTYIIPAVAIAAVIALLVLKRGRGRPKLTRMMGLGDSLMLRTGASGAEKNKDMKPQLAPVGIDLAVNYGEGGKRCDEILAKQLKPALKSGIKLALITGGWNDILQSHDIEQVVDDMKATDKALMDVGITVIRLLPHYGKHSTHEPLRAHVDAVCTHYKMPWCIDLRTFDKRIVTVDGLHWADSDRDLLVSLIADKCREMGTL